MTKKRRPLSGSLKDRILASVRAAESLGAPVTYASVFCAVIPSYLDGARNAAGFKQIKRGIDALVDSGALRRTFTERRVFHLSIPAVGDAA